MFRDRRKTAEEKGKSYSASAVTKILCGNEKPGKVLEDFFISYNKWAYSAIESNKMVSLVDVAGITISAIYSLLDFASIIVPIDELEKCLRLKIFRNDLEPSPKWFSGLKKVTL